MRLFLLLLLTLALTTLIALFPEVAEQQMRIEAFGWMLEAKQGAFIVLLLLVLGVIWAIQRLLTAALSGPGHLWRAIRIGGRKRREAQLKDNIARLIDMRQGVSARSIGKARGIVPDWGLALLRTLATPAIDQPPPASDRDALQTALAARIVTDPLARPRPDVATRKAHLEAWLKASPDAPLAITRLPDIAEDEADWPKLVRMLEAAWEKGGEATADIKPRLAHAYVELARTQAGERPDEAIASLRKAYQLQPDAANIVLELGKAHVARDDVRAARKLWHTYLEQHDNEQVAEALFAILKPDAMRAYRKLEKEQSLHASLLWLRAQLARAAGLDGLAEEHMSRLLEQHPGSLAWKTRGDWYAAEELWQEASRCYRQALDKPRKMD